VPAKALDRRDFLSSARYHCPRTIHPPPVMMLPEIFFKNSYSPVVDAPPKPEQK